MHGFFNITERNNCYYILLFILLHSVYEMLNKRDLFTVHVGNLNAKTTVEELETLFAGTGEIKDIFIQDKFNNSQYTYAFVRYRTLDECRIACTTIHGSILHGTAIYVTYADSTQERVGGCQGEYNSSKNSSREKSISKVPFPRREGAHYLSSQKDENDIHKKLTDSLSNLKNGNRFTSSIGIETEEDIKCFMSDFKEALVSMSRVPESVGVESRVFEKTQDMADLEQLITDHYSCSKPTQENTLNKLDFDATASK